MKKISELKFLFPDAENYRRREFKQEFNKSFLTDNYLSEILLPEVSFLMGEKGTGKTAYAIYIANNKYCGYDAELKFIRETEYQKFITLKKDNKLDLSDYTNIWRVLLLLMMSKQIAVNEPTLIPRFIKFRNINSAIDKYYKDAFKPEIIHAMEFVQEAKVAAELLSTLAKASGEAKEIHTFNESRFQTSLLFIQREFEKALDEIKLSSNHVIFIDGIDIRPHGIDYEDYLECVKGLANAVWQMNNDFFPNIKDSKGRMKIVLLIRPDIFSSIGMQNTNTKLRTNTVMLDWRTTYENFKTSKLFGIACKALHAQQRKEAAEDLQDEDVWSHYFPYVIRSNIQNENDNAFIGFLRNSFYRPRDIIMMLSILKEVCDEKGIAEKSYFELSDFESNDFKRKLADYFLSEIKDQISFYYSDRDYNLFIDFFNYLNGNTRFDFEEYELSFGKFIENVHKQGQSIPKFMDSKYAFLQFLYELNIINFVEDMEDGGTHIHWCFRERKFSNISPQVKFDMRYEIFYGLTRAVNTGKKIKKTP